MKPAVFFRGFFYGMGLFILALGIMLNTKTNLGVSPIISVAYSVSTIWELNFGNVTFALYGVFVLVEMVLHLLRSQRLRMGKQTPFPLRSVLMKDVLQLPLSLFFTRFLNLFAFVIPDMTGDSPHQLLGRFFFLIIAIILTGIGATLSLHMRLIPNPGDGIVQALADTVNRSTGLVKNFFDLFCIVSTIAISLLFTGHLVGIGAGTVLAVIGVGRVMAIFNHICGEKMVRLAGGHVPS